MAYVRFSSDNFKSDVYAYESAQGFVQANYSISEIAIEERTV